MQGQGKNLLIAVALALGVMFAWNMIFPPEKTPPKKEVPTQPGAAPEPTAQTAVGVTADGVRVAPPAQRGPEQLIELKYPNVEATFSSHGGVLKSWYLTDKRYKHDKTKGELLPTQPDTGAFGVNFASSTFVLPPNADWVGTKLSDTQVAYKISTDTLDVEKTFTIIPDAYIVKMTVKVTTKVKPGSEAKQTLAITTFGFHDPKDSGGGGQSIAPRVWESATYRRGEHLQTGVKAVLKKPRYEDNINWTGFEHPYLLVGMAPRPVAEQSVRKHTIADASGLMRTDMIYPMAVFRSDSAPLEREVVGFLGPKNYKQLENADSVAKFTTAFKETIDLGWFAFIGRPLLWLLLKFYSFLGNWGLAIVLLTILVKGATIPFTTRSMRSMKAIAVLAPELKALQEKYKDDRQRLQMETMALYRQHKANPLSGCLPILLQMPIWLALYRMLSSASEMYLQPFIPGWINDLTTSDPYYVMPIVLLVTMFAQARLQPMAPPTDPTQKLQQRMMMYGLPLMFGIMAFFFPAGLTLYIFTNTILSALHSIYMNKYDKKSLELAAKLKAAQEKKAQAANKDAAGKAKDANVKAKASTPVEDEADDEDDEDDTSQPTGNKPGPRPNQSRQKRKKRRR